MLVLASCKNVSTDGDAISEEENQEAKQMLQGIWANADDELVAMYVRGDSIIYADSTLAPVRFAIVNDSLVLRGHEERRYAIVKQTEHLFQYISPSGDIVKLVRTENEGAEIVFAEPKKPATAENKDIIKRDSVITHDEYKYHVYTTINPSNHKVICTSYNLDGAQSETIYNDNIINVSIFNGAKRMFSRDFRKKDLAEFIPEDYLNESILCDITLDDLDDNGLEMSAFVGTPDEVRSYVVRLLISHDGKLTMKKE